MYDGYNKIFWGSMITSFNINLGPINILPNFLGFILIVSGLNMLYRESSFAGFNNISSMGMIVAVLSFIGGAIGYLTGGMHSYYFINIIWTIGFITIEFILFFKVLEVSIEYLKENNYHEIKERHILKLRNYTILTIINILALGISLIFNLETYMAIIVIPAFALKIYLISIIYDLRNIYKEEKPSEEDEIEEFK